MKRVAFIGILLLTFFSCKKEESTPISSNFEWKTPIGFPEVAFTVGNEFSLKRWELGKKLFYDTRLSSTNTVSCASCHAAHLAFSDSTTVSLGVEGRLGLRNAPTLANVAYHPYYTREGGVPTLEMQILVPIQEHNEFDFNMVELAAFLKKDTALNKMALESYGREIDPFVITRSISNFERSLLSGNSKYDKFGRNEVQLSDNEQKGKNLFFSERLNCATCHSGFNFTNYSFQNNGLYENYLDIGRKRLTEKDEDLSLFKVPTLRNIEVTAPYMHDGSLKTIDDVIEHYNSGGKNHPHKSSLIKPLGLSEQEKGQLKEFLLTLTDYEFINNQYFRK